VAIPATLARRAAVAPPGRAFVTKAIEAVGAVAIAAAFMTASAHLQAPSRVVLWDARQYYGMTDRLAHGQRAFAEVPYVYRVGIPWLVSRLSPSNPREGFTIVNVVAGLMTAALLDLWLQAWVAGPRIRLALVALFAGAWHGPVRYVFFNSGYVDPPFLVCLVAALLLIRSLSRRYSIATMALLLAVTAAGTLVRETMALVALAFLFVDNPVLGRHGANRSTGSIVPLAARFAPVVLAAAIIAWTHRIVTVDTAERSFIGAVMQYLHKSPLSYALAWFTAFGPVLAILVFDWRGAWRDLSEHEWLAVLFALCAALAFIGGSDTERFVFWTMPIVYLLIGRAIERHAPVFRRPAIVSYLVVLQAVSARVFWGIPDPTIDGALLVDQSFGAAVYGVLDRLIVIDHFHWNLWSNFGSHPFRIARLAGYLLITGALVWAMRRRSREAAPA
jgi:hypothetical protein